MRLLAEIVVIGALIYVGWEKPFRDQLPASVTGVAKSKSNATAAPHQPFVRSTSTPSGTWMWDPNRHTALDSPTPKQPSPH